jgi:hypothetical protein
MLRLPLASCLLLFAFASFVFAADWLTDGGDIRRTNWQRDEKILTKTNVKGMQLLMSRARCTRSSSRW